MNYKEYKGKYFGLDKIKKVKLSDKKTYKGNNVLELIFENDMIKNIPEEVFKYSVTDNAIDLSSLRDKLIEPVIKKMVEILLESQLKIEDFEYLFIQIKGKIQNSIQKAMDILWAKNANLLILEDIDNVLKYGQSKNNN